MADESVVSLRDYTESKFAASEKAVMLAFDALKIQLLSIDKATEVARVSMEARLATMNEFRETLKNQQANFVGRPELGPILDDIRSLRESRAEIIGKADQSTVNVSVMLSMLSLFIAIIGLVIVWIRK